MEDDDVKRLLGAAEGDLQRRPFAAAQFAQRVRELQAVRRRRRARMAAAGGSLAAVAVVFAAWQLISYRVDRAPAGNQVAEQKASASKSSDADLRSLDIERLRAQAEFHRQVAHELQAMRERRKTAAMIAARASVRETHEPLDVVAYRMILRADALRAAMRPLEEAAGIYRQVVRLFPTTGSAELARQRLIDAGISGGDI